MIWEKNSSYYNINFKLIQGIKNTLATTLSRLIDGELTEPNVPGKESYEYGHAMFVQLPDIYVDSSRDKPVTHVNV